MISPTGWQPAVPSSEAPGPGLAGTAAVEIVHVCDLHKHLRFPREIEYPASSLRKPLSQWKMQIDDAPIFRYIYRNARPRRHLEFGTWMGEGVLYCLEECEATVWTINLPFGEGDAYGFEADDVEKARAWAERIGVRWSHDYRSDSVGFIGHHYLLANAGSRVCQIYCDSTQWDTANFPEGFFDTVLIDGGHTKDIVISDTRKALPLARPGAIVMWHDFCPRVYPEKGSTVGVIDAIGETWEWLQTQCEALAWIYPSWILVGVKK